MDNKIGRAWMAFIALATGGLAIVGYLLFNQATGYEYLSDWHVLDLMRAKFWSIGWLLLAFFVVYWKRRSPVAPYLAVLAVSVYFVFLYGLLFRGTEFGMNGHWGDNGNRLAQICKMMAYNTLFTDWYLKDLPAFYPPLWFGLMTVYAKVLGLEAYQTIKFGYLLIFLGYPWLLFCCWRKLVSPVIAAGIAVSTVFFAYKYLDWIYYEHITAALFIPWWLYYFERCKDYDQHKSFDWKFYLAGAVYGGLMVMTYYYWFAMAALALPFMLGVRYYETRSLRSLWYDIRHKLILMLGVALISAIYWVPLLKSIITYGGSSMQNIWFGTRHAHLLHQWETFSIESVLIYVGVFFVLYLWDYFGKAKLPLLFLGGLLIILLDRVLNFGESSVQSRKILEFVHVFTIVPATIGFFIIREKLKDSPKIARGVLGVLILLAIAISNNHSEIYEGVFYKTGLAQRVPEANNEIFDAVGTVDKVYLTDHYLEACYRPYYLFVTVNNMTAHTAGRLAQRKMFLDQAATITEPDLLAYCLAYNKYSPIDYVYLPINKETGTFELTLYEVNYNRTANAVKKLFRADHKSSPELFIKRHDAGVFELAPAPRSGEIDDRIKAGYPDMYEHLQPADS